MQFTLNIGEAHALASEFSRWASAFVAVPANSVDSPRSSVLAHAATECDRWIRLGQSAARASAHECGYALTESVTGLETTDLRIAAGMLP